MAEAASLSSSGAPGRHQRRVKNYLLDTHFQLKYSGYLVLLAVVLSAGLGFMLFRSSSEVIDQSAATVRQGDEVVARGREVVAESQKVSAVVQMNIIKDPVYSDNPALLEAFKSDAAQQDKLLKDQQERLQKQAAQLKEQAAGLVTQRRVMLASLFGGLALLVVLIGFGGIVVTHRVAGPIYKMKMNLKAVADGHLRIPTPLRKGDELVEFFEAYRKMVIALRGRQEDEILRLEKAIVSLETKTGASELDGLNTLKRDMKAALDT
jgi:nitrogen fixation/metabolism regulation signal transduction histidine kinase